MRLCSIASGSSGNCIYVELTESEKELGFECVWETLENIYEVNKEKCKSPCSIRDTLFIKMMLDGQIILSEK